MAEGYSRSASNSLTDRAIKAFITARQAGKAAKSKLTDGGGMFLALTKAGTAVWRMKYRIDNKEKLYAIGTYPTVSLEAARKEREKARACLREGRDPVTARFTAKAAALVATDDKFTTWAEAWLEKKKKDGWSDTHYRISRRALERDVLPGLGRLPLTDITPKMIAGVIEAVDKGRGRRETAGKILQHINAILRYAQAKGALGKENPAAPVKEILSVKPLTKRMPARLEFKELGAILRGAEAVHLSPSVRMAHRLCAFTAMRMGPVAGAEWQEFDLEADNPVWTIPRQKMKAKRKYHDHKVFLCPAIVQELADWRRTIGNKGFVFPSVNKGRHITLEAVEKVYRVTLGLKDKHTPHGWRAAFSTLAREKGFEQAVVELALDHVFDTEVVRAYDRGERLEKRIELMNWWGGKLVEAQRSMGELKVFKNKAA